MKESGLLHETCLWCYRGVWGTLTKYFCLPDGPPNLPIMEGDLRPLIYVIESFFSGSVLPLSMLFFRCCGLF
jgi:hypothetical protein